MQRPLQPAYKIRVFTQGAKPSGNEGFYNKGDTYASSNHSFMDIEECVSFGVTYETQATLLNTLSFKIDKHAEVLLHRLHLGQSVVFYGGYYSDSQFSFRKLFVGTVIRIVTHFSDTGIVTITVECMEYGYNKLGKDTAYYVYPDKNSKRKFAQGKTSITLKEIIEGICEENDVNIGEISLPKVAMRRVFTEDKIQAQKGLSDWAFLNELAKSYGCSIWIDNLNGEDKFYFVDTSQINHTKGPDIQFLYLLKGERTTDVKDNEIIRVFGDAAWNRPRLLNSVTVTEDISLAYSVSRSAQYFDKETGETVEAIAEITGEEGKRVVTFYELDEDKVRQVEEKNPKLAEQIRSMEHKLTWSSGCKDPKDEKPEFTRYYYKVKKVMDESVEVFDQVFFGIYVTASCNLDLDIRIQRTYPIRGILRYNTKKEVGNYYLRGLKHIWDAEGARTELDFIQ